MGGIPSLSILSKQSFLQHHNVTPSQSPTLYTPSHLLKLSTSFSLKLSPKSSFLVKNSKVLNSKSHGVIPPELRLLRTILSCDYGRSKFIQYLINQTPILLLYQNIPDEKRFYQHFLSKYLKSSSTNSLLSHRNSSQVNLYKSVSDIAKYDKYFILLCALSWYHSYISSPEHLEWMKYQYMIKESEEESSSHNSIGSISEVSSHRLVRELQNLDYCKLLNKSQWIVAFAHVLEEIPYPTTIFNKEDGRVLFANSTYVELVGYTREEITLFTHDKYHSPHGELDTDPAITYSINSGTSLKIGIMYHPKSPLTPFLDLQSYISLFDRDGHCHYILVLHCDIWKYRYNFDYLQKLDLLTDIVSKAVIPQRECGGVFLKAYFYNTSTSSHQTTESSIVQS